VRRPQRVVAGALVASALASVGAMVVYVLGGQTQWEGALLAVALGGLGTALLVWGKKLLPLPPGGVTQPRHPEVPAAGERAELHATLEAGEHEVGRRTFLVRLLLAAAGALGLAALFPIRSLGPSPGRALFSTSWRAGMRVVTRSGEPIGRADLEQDSFVTVFPEGFEGSGEAQAVLFHVDPSTLQLPPDLLAAAPEGFVAYSKVCTHAGCPLGLYLADLQQLRCPCHQSTFDILDGAKPVYGPAPRPLPQLPLAFDDEGFLVAQGDFTAPVGPAFWQLGSGE
jgi:ubiquinol-cytochrome c reductase iron-sulfur subunit